MLSETKVQRGILLFAEPMSTEMINTLNSLLNEHNSNTFFYLVYNEASVDDNDKMSTSNGPFYMNWFQVKMSYNFVNLNSCIKSRHPVTFVSLMNVRLFLGLGDQRLLSICV